MTSRQKRFQEKKAEEVRYALKGFVKCPECKKYSDPNKMEESFWIPTKDPMCKDCLDKHEVQFVRDIQKEMDRGGRPVLMKG